MEVEATKTYAEIEKLLQKICWAFQRRYGGEFDDLMSTANMTWLTAPAHDPERAAYSTYIYQRVWNALRNERRANETYHHYVGTREPSKLMDECYDLPGMELGPDAETVVGLALDPPAPLRRDGAYAPGRRNALVRYLRGLGWTAKRITESFDEIRSALR
jgi:DNA-directed RNA polymerase specialized sigma24 family protein